MPDHSSFYRQQRQTTAPQPTVLEERVVGVTYENRQEVVSRLRVEDAVILRREPANAYDRNAIRVENAGGEQIGFIRRELAQQIAPVMDRTNPVIWGIVIAKSGDMLSGQYLGVRIRFAVPGGVAHLPPPEDIDW